MKTPTKRTLRWERVDQRYATVQRGDGKLLGIVVTKKGPHVIALALETIVGGTANDILNDHSHKRIGTYRGLRMATKASESFARSWLRKHEGARVAKCRCDDIGKPKGTRKRRTRGKLRS